MSDGPAGGERTVRLPAGGVTLEGTLGVPPGARGVVLFAHGSGSSRHSSRNRFVAAGLREARLATLLIDLLTAAEESVDVVTFGIGMLADRLVGADDVPVIGMNRDAMSRMRAPLRLEIVPGATHLFEEPGKLDEVLALARDLFVDHLASPR